MINMLIMILPTYPCYDDRGVQSIFLCYFSVLLVHVVNIYFGGILSETTQGGWVPIKGPSAIQLATSLSSLTNLTAFTLKKDCTLDILKALVNACSQVLRFLDVEESRGVGFS